MRISILKASSSTNLSRKDSAGFTLVELIVVISVLAVLSVVGIAAFASYSRAQTLNAAAGDLAVMFNLAKSRAYSQIKPSQCPDSIGSLDGYEVRICSNASCTISGSGTSFALFVTCGGATRPPPISTANFSNSNLTFTSIQPSVYSFFFPVLKGSVVGSGTITISNTFNETRMVTVDSSGNIKVN